MARRREQDLFGLSLDAEWLEKLAAGLSVQTEEVAVSRANCESSLANFVREAWPIVEPANPYVPGWHLGCIYEHLEALTSLEIQRLILNMPPRHQKSLAACVFWFCWVWAKFPSTRWLYASYDAGLSYRDARKCQDVIQSPWYQARWGHVFQLRRGERALSKFTNTKMGHRISTSVMGRGTGEGGDYLVADDPHKASDIYSEVYRERAARWWGETMSTRGDSPKTVRKLVVMQRLHERDLTGHLLASKLDYEHLCLPAEYEPRRYFFSEAAATGSDGKTRIRDAVVLTKLQRDRPRLRDPRTVEGEPLWPERFGKAELEALKAELKQFGTSGQLQQRPSPTEGDVFKRSCFRYFTEEAKELEEGKGVVPCFVLFPEAGEPPITVPQAVCSWFQTADTALSVSATARYTAVGTFVSCPIYRGGALVARALLVYDMDREKLTVPTQYRYLTALRSKFPNILFMAVEPKASGIGLLQEAMADGRPFKKLQVGLAAGDDVNAKVRRAAAVSGLYEVCAVYHRQGMANLTDFEDEILSFPTGAYDDWVDCLSYGGILFNQERILIVGRELIAEGPGESGIGQTQGDVYEVNGVRVEFPEERPWWEL